MSRRHIAFACEGVQVFGTIDLPEGPVAGRTGLLIVSGGNEVRAGAWNGQALLAARIAALGHPVLRFDRRGVGESEGENRGFRGSAHDITAALAAFRAELPELGRVIGLGNCDAAAALMLSKGCGMDGLVLTNPWTIEAAADESEDYSHGKGADAAAAPAPAPTVLRAHYARRLADPAALRRLFSGKVSLRGLARSLFAMTRKEAQTTLAREMASGLAQYSGPVKILLAGRDRTAQAFLGQWDKTDPRITLCPEASHSFVEPESRKWLENNIFIELI